MDEYEIDESLRLEGVIGRIDNSYAEPILDALIRAIFIPERDKERLRTLFAEVTG